MKKADIESIRHSLAHLLAAAVKELYPEAKPTIGPAIENGFYYDFDNLKISDADLPNIEAKMKELLPEWKEFTKEEKSRKEAEKDPVVHGNVFKKELLDEAADRGDTITFYTCGGFTDLCRGGHAEHPSKDIKANAFKLTRLAGAYWRGDEKNPQLTRIYGLAFASKKELDEHLALMEEAKKRDHRKLGKELGLFSIIEAVGPGLPLFLPKGAILRRIVENFIAELQEKKGYEPIWIPHITKGDLYKISGHLEKYDALYPPMHLKDESDYFIKPMNCPHFMMLYRETQRSYRELPVRWTATTTNYRYEKSGELTGLTRVRALTQDDCHVFCRPDQIEHEITLMLDMIKEAYSAFGFTDFWVRISTRDPKDKTKYIGDEKVWNDSEATLEKLIKKRGWKHEIGEGEAAFYGPKLDFIFKDVLGREWQLSTIQLDMNLPKRFSLEYVDEDGKKEQPVVIHRAILGSTERFLGILIEHTAGAFPLWLSPVQTRVLAISDKFQTYAEKVTEALKMHGIRAELTSANETLGKRIREAQVEKIPYTVIVGEKEMEAKTINIRDNRKNTQGESGIDEAVEKLKKEIAERN